MPGEMAALRPVASTPLASHGALALALALPGREDLAVEMAAG